MDANNSAMEATSEAGSPRTQVTKSSKPGIITLHHNVMKQILLTVNRCQPKQIAMDAASEAMAELRRKFNGFQEPKQIAAEENANDKRSNSNERERRIKELEETVTERNRILKETETRLKEAAKRIERRIKELEQTVTERNRILKEAETRLKGAAKRIKCLEAQPQLNAKEHRIQSTDATKDGAD